MTASIAIAKVEVETIGAALSSWIVAAPCSTVKLHSFWSTGTELSVYTVRSCGLLSFLLLSFSHKKLDF